MKKSKAESRDRCVNPDMLQQNRKGYRKWA